MSTCSLLSLFIFHDFSIVVILCLSPSRSFVLCYLLGSNFRPSGLPCGPLAPICAPIWSRLAPFWLPLVPSGSLLVPFGTLWVSFTRYLPFLVPFWFLFNSFRQHMLRVSFSPGRDRTCGHFWISSCWTPLENGCCTLSMFKKGPFRQYLNNIWKQYSDNTRKTFRTISILGIGE